ncbi:putative helicase mov-10-B.1 [Drosophila montana]|uniref:putative helicase mov-10-B.1 n=1 Tax=Drosophila montana TaxID=40370 RepID=UPI00313B6DD8
MNVPSNYAPIEKMLRALELKFSDEILGENDATFASYLVSRQLSIENVCSVLTTLISIEDISRMLTFAELMQFDVSIKETKNGNCSIPLPKKNSQSILIPYVDEVLLLPSGTLQASLTPRERIVKLTSISGLAYIVSKATKECVVFRRRHSVISPENFKNHKFDVIFRSPRIPFRLMYRALNLLSTSPETRRYLFPLSTIPKCPSQLKSFPLLNNNIASNPEQLKAVQQIVAGPNPQAPYVLFGPPGTGKTTTIVEAILQLYLQKKSRILVTIASNSACDTIAFKLIEYIEKDKRFQELAHHKYVLLRLVSYTRFRKSAKSMNRLVLRYSNYELFRANKKKTSKYIKQIELEDCGIVVATLCTASMRAGQSPHTFTHIFIDEAASASEPETAMAIAGIKSRECHIILSGDHKQLGPHVKSGRAVTLGLDHSLFERLMKHNIYEEDDSGAYDCTLQSRLRRNFRAHPEIVGIYNKLYYNNELLAVAPLSQVNQAAKWSLLPNGKFPILFQATKGAMESETNSTSSFNKLEAMVVCWYVMSLLKEGLGDVRVDQGDIGVVTPYLAQRNLLKRMLRLRGHPNVEVGTVESYQGREKPIIIASLVSSFKSTSFLSDPRRINVLLSRAKVLMILIGNPISLEKNYHFKFIIDQCKANHNFLENVEKFKDDSLEGLISKMNLKDDESEDSCSSSEEDD